MNGYPSFYPRIALVAPSPDDTIWTFWDNKIRGCWWPGSWDREVISHHAIEWAAPWLPVASCTKEVNTLRPRQNGRHFTDIFKCIFLGWKCLNSDWNFTEVCPLEGPIYNILALVQIMAWCRPGDKPLSEAMMVNLPMHICVTRPQWVNPWLAKWLLLFKGHLANHGLASLMKESTGIMISTACIISLFRMI